MKTSARRFDIALLVGLLLLATLVQWLIVRRAVTPSLDAVRYVRLADAIGQSGIVETVKREGEQPLYPLWIHTVERTISTFQPIDRATAAQTASAVAMILLVIPFYFAARQLVGRLAATVGTLLLIVIPDIARLGGDATSDSLHLLFFTIAFWAIVAWIGERSERAASRGTFQTWGLPALAGVAIGAALMTRVESIVLLVALPLFLIESFLRRENSQLRVPWAVVGATVGLALVWLPFLIATDSLNIDGAKRRLLGRPDPQPVAATSTVVEQLSSGAGSFAAKEPTHSIRSRGSLATLVRVSRKLAAAFGYWIGLAAIWGAVRLSRRRLRPAERFARIFVGVYLLVALMFCMKEGYLESRHLMPLVIASLGSAGLGVLLLARLLCRTIGRSYEARLRPRGRAIWTTAAVALIAAGSLPWTLAPLHASRLGHRQAGAWLADRTPQSATVVDTFGWTGLYSTRATYLYPDADRWLADPQVKYLIVEESEIDYDSPRAETLRRLITQSGPPLVRFPNDKTAETNQQIVCIYKLRLEEAGVKISKRFERNNNERR